MSSNEVLLRCLLTANHIESIQTYMRKEVEMLTFQLLQFLYKHLTLTIHDVDELFEDFEMECWCDNAAPLMPLFAIG